MIDPQYALGVDLGGSNLRVGVVSRAGEVLDFAKRPIPPDATGDEVLARMRDLASGMPHLPQVTAVGVGLAAVIFPDGVIRGDLVNLPGLDGYRLGERVAQAFDRPCFLDNDALVALLGEHHFGAGRGCADLLLLTLGTGIGGALMLNGVLRRGPHGLGCEIGMLPFPNPDMRHLTPFERLASPKAVRQRLGSTGGYLFERVAAGDEDARQAVAEMLRYLGWLVTALHLTADFKRVILSGGLAEAGQPLADGVQAAFGDICPPGVQFDLEVVVGGLAPQTAGVVGAAAMCFEEIRS